MLTEFVERGIIIGLNQGFDEGELLRIEFREMAAAMRFREDVSGLMQSLQERFHKTQRNLEAVG